MESVAPNIFVKNITPTIGFYKELGFALITTVPEQGDYVWAMMKCGTVTFMIQTYESLGDGLPGVHRQDGGSLLFYVSLKGIRDFLKKIEAKVTVLKGLEKTFYGATEFSIKDNNGYVITFAEHEQSN